MKVKIGEDRGIMTVEIPLQAPKTQKPKKLKQLRLRPEILMKPIKANQFS